MPRQPLISIENNFVGGLRTEHSGLNFPPNACTDTNNCVFERTGHVTRRKGINFENLAEFDPIDISSGATSTFIWKNADGAGLTELLVVQMGSTLHFYSRNSTGNLNPISSRKLTGTIDILTHKTTEAADTDVSGNECQYAAGKGRLFVFHPYTEPFFCELVTANIVSSTSITLRVRDFEGVPEEGVEDKDRPFELTDEHSYNLTNQGWGKAWEATSTTANTLPGTTDVDDPGEYVDQTFTFNAIPSALKVGDRVRIVPQNGAFSGDAYGVGPVTEISGTDVTIRITEVGAGSGAATQPWSIRPEYPYIHVWFDEIQNYPSNADVWWFFKNADGDYDPEGTINRIEQATGKAPKGYFIMDAFNQDRDEISGLDGLPTVTSEGIRPSTGAWFGGRVWYSGIAHEDYTGKIYFSQIVEADEQLGRCYQVNDPPSEERFDLLPSDGGVISIQEAGSIHKLFPVHNGMLIFAENGVWFLTGSQGIGFTANDYTVVKLSNVRSISGSSFVDVLGYPFFWNEEGIYATTPAEGGGQLTVKSLTESTIATFYEAIPIASKKTAKGAFDPIKNIIQWVYRQTSTRVVPDKYQFNRILNFNVQLSCFYPWTLPNSTQHIRGIEYITGDVDSPNPIESKFRYVVTESLTTMSIAEEWDEDYVDWGYDNFNSYFVTGYKLDGQAQRQFQSNYVFLYLDNTEDNSFAITGLWDYANSADTNRWTSPQIFTVDAGDYDNVVKKIKIRGAGKVLQYKIESRPSVPFNIIGWSVFGTQNTHI